MSEDIKGAVTALIDRTIPEEQRNEFKEAYGLLPADAQAETDSQPNELGEFRNVEDFKDYLTDVDQVETLDSLQRQEEDGKNRQTYLRAIAARREEVEAE